MFVFATVVAVAAQPLGPGWIAQVEGVELVSGHPYNMGCSR